MTIATEPLESNKRDIVVTKLLVLCAQKDKRAFRMLYDMEAARLYPVALRITRNKGLAHDVLHDVMFHAWQNANQFDAERDNGRIWLISLTRRTALEIRSQEQEQNISYGLFQGAGSKVDPLEQIALTETGNRLRECIEILQGRRTDLVVMAFIDGLTHTQVATRTGYQLGTVKSKIRRALIALRNCLDSNS